MDVLRDPINVDKDALLSGWNVLRDLDFPGYSLHLRDESDSPRLGVDKKHWLSKYSFLSKLYFSQMLITSREVKGEPPYEKAYSLLRPDSNVCEAGAGLGEFIPKCSEQVEKRPTVIDMLDYELVEKFINRMLHKRQAEFNERNEDQLVQVLERISIYRDRDRVRLLSGPLQKIIPQNPDLAENVDVVVDNFGPHYYGKMFAGRIFKLEKSLLTPGGKIVADGCEFSGEKGVEGFYPSVYERPASK